MKEYRGTPREPEATERAGQRFQLLRELPCPSLSLARSLCLFRFERQVKILKVRRDPEQEKRRVLGAIEVSRVSVIFYDALYAGPCVCVCLMAGNVMTVGRTQLIPPGRLSVSGWLKLSRAAAHLNPIRMERCNLKLQSFNSAAISCRPKRDFLLMLHCLF